jgi:Fic family protein
MKPNFNTLIKVQRNKQKLLIRDVAAFLEIDSALVSRFEKGERIPTKEQLMKLIEVLKLKEKEAITSWLGAKIFKAYQYEDFIVEALHVAEEMFEYESNNVTAKNKWYDNATIKALLNTIDERKKVLSKLRKNDSYRITEALELQYTYNSNKIEGNTLTLKETDIVINEGITIAGKTMREHLEAINHSDAIQFIKHIVAQKNTINERIVLQIHNLVLRGIDADNAGTYRNVQVMIKGSKHMPPQPFLVPKQMEDYFLWYKANKHKLHPVILAAEMHERLVTIHPFIDGNGRTSRLVMNLILLQHGFVIANIKGDNKNRLTYYTCLEAAQTTNHKNDFIQFVAQTALDCINEYINILGG